MEAFKNATEKFVFQICEETFLRLWSYANPRNAEGKELCDALVVCEPDVVVISVKDPRLKLDATPDLAMGRWLKKAVRKSVDQLYGASRWLQSAERVIRTDGSEGLPLPPLDVRRVHLVSVSLGAGGLAPLPHRDHGKGFVHIFDEQSFRIVMAALDTITDLVDYLVAKERFAERCPGLVVQGEENLLALYLHRGRTFPDPCPEEGIPDGLWEQLAAKPEYQRGIRENKVSYIWDGLVNYFARHALAGTFEIGAELSESEVAFREMALESRFGRRVMGQSLVDFLKLAKAGEVRARMVQSPRGVGYVFLNASPGDDRDRRVAELKMRSFIARGELGCEKVIGIGVNVEPAPRGYCEDVVFLQIPEWTGEHEAEANRLKEELRFFASPVLREDHIEEYPRE